LTPFKSTANTMQALVKYHGLKDWKLRIPYHDSISVNTTSIGSQVVVREAKDGGAGDLLVEGKKNDDALKRIQSVSRQLTGKDFEELARNSLDEKTYASYAAADGALFIRTGTRLYRFQSR